MAANPGLSAAEVSVLLSAPRYDARRAVKLGLMGLLAQGLVRMETKERRVMLRRFKLVSLHAAPGPTAAASPAAESLLRVVRATEPEGKMADVVKQSQREYGSGLAGFADRYVLPALIGRGLVEARRARFLGLFPVTRHVRTAAGEAEKSRLDRAMAEARAIPQYLAGDPARAAALVATLGAAILLIEELNPHYQAIAMAMRQHGDGDFAGGGDFDFGGVDFGSADFSGVDFAGFDAGFSDAGGDGGGGDGGGDGGGSGC